VPVGGEPVTIGTARESDIVLPDGASEERRHARVWYRDGSYMLHRLARQGDVRVDGQPIQWVTLEPGDEFAIGPHHFRFETNGLIHGAPTERRD